MWGLIAALAAGYAVWAPTWRRRPAGGAARPARPPRPAAWVTAEALRWAGWTPARARLYQAAAAGVAALAWGGLTQNLIAGLLFAVVGWQVPLFVAELRAGGLLSRQLRQATAFIATVADAVNTGQSLPLAVDTAARQVTEPPLAEPADTLIRQVASGVPVPQALSRMGEAVRWPWWDLFVDLAALLQQTGGSGVVFEQLAWQLQEQERIQQEFRALISVFFGLVCVFLALTLGAAVGEALLDGAFWAQVTTHFGWLVILSTGLVVVTFGGVRRYARMWIAL